MKALIQISLLVFSVISTPVISWAQFLEEAQYLDVVSPNENQCRPGNDMIENSDSRLLPGRKAVWRTQNSGVDSPLIVARWELEVLKRDQDQLIVRWDLRGGTGLDILPEETTSFVSECRRSSCSKNLGRFELVGEYSPCRLSQGMYTSGREAIGFFKLAESQSVVRAVLKVSTYQGTLYCHGKEPQFGYREDTIVISEDVPNYTGLTSCQPHIVFRRHQFYNRAGEEIHDIQNQLLDADLERP